MTPNEIKGLYAEVVTHDCYKLRNLKFFKPVTVYDIGANIGIFSRFARELFPDAYIVAVEPHPENIATYVNDPPSGLFELMPCALGRDGHMWHNKGAANGSGESYVSSGLGYDEDEMANNPDTERIPICAKMLPEIATRGLGFPAIMKIDCEGGENVIWEDEESMNVLKQMDYIAMETHFYAHHGGELYDNMRKITMDGIESLKETHHVDFKHPYLFAHKKIQNESRTQNTTG